MTQRNSRWQRRIGSRGAGRAMVALAVTAAVGAATGCGLTVENVPLPKPGQSGETYTIRAYFANALNLPDQAKVKIGGSDVGVVSHIETKNFQAVVDLRIRKDIELPKGSTAELRQATPLGDVFVAVSKPQVAPGTPMLHNGDSLPIEQTAAGATVEELLMSVSMLFNGGGIAAIGKLTSELDSAVGGRADQLGDLLKQLTTVTTNLNANSQRVDDVLAGFHTLAGTLQAHHDELGQVASSLPQMIGAIAENDRNLGELLTKLSSSSAALGDYANTSGDQLAGLLDSTTRLMGALAATGDNFGALMDSLHQLRPGVDATFKGDSLAAQVNVTNLDAALLTAPGTSKFWDLRDLQDFAGSLVQVLQIVQGRVNGAHR
ncbi:MCE family protein [Nocardia sp. alder85J]|uniref:MCE family protein n=1 Tax=Nocardia sp. alder85J TaxID=2862949 RepID=UPI001CD80C6E|nr:MCE family protein [Nocardia sp. alder85J]MCX4096482.1 MCE family protein [Nocardia sp. alder85J]